jgi:hypothetical protein
MTFRALFRSLLLIAAFTVSSYSWSTPGHMAVAYVAYQNLKPDVRARVDALVAMNPKFVAWKAQIPAGTSDANAKMMLFMVAATWPDQIKSDGHVSDGPDGGNTPPAGPAASQNTGYSDMAMHKYWHFIDEPFSVDGTKLIRPNTPNAQTEIKLFRAALASDESDALKSYDLVWLLHIVGDIHQPLHATSRFSKTLPKGDNGANDVKVCNKKCVDDELHGFWDGIFGTTANQKKALSLAIAAGKGLTAAPSAAANNLDESAWVNESFTLAKSKVYMNPPIQNGAGPFQITDQYRSMAVTVASGRVALAGARLANILNKELR